MPWNLFTHRPGSWKSSVGLTTALTLWTRLSSLCGSSVVGSSFKSIALGNLNSWWNELILPLIKLTRRGICQLACHNLPRSWMMATFEFDRIQWVIKTDFTQGWNLKWWDGKSTWNLMVVKHHCHGKMMELLTILKAKKCFWQIVQNLRHSLTGPWWFSCQVRTHDFEWSGSQAFWIVSVSRLWIPSFKNTWGMLSSCDCSNWFFPPPSSNDVSWYLFCCRPGLIFSWRLSSATSPQTKKYHSIWSTRKNECSEVHPLQKS